MNKEVSSLLVLCNYQPDYLLFKQIITQYFPSPDHDHIFVNNKYYSANILIRHQTWPTPQELSLLSLQKMPQVQNKQDLIVMLLNHSQSQPAQMYDYVIHKHSPQSFMVVVNVESKGAWSDDAKISSEVNNFIEVVKENLQSLVANPPQRKEIGLLTDTYEEGSIFSLLQMIETTPWRHIDKKPKESKEEKQKQNISEQNQKDSQQYKHQDQPKQQLKNVQKPQYRVEQQRQPQLDDQQLQRQMMQFQSLMREVMTMKNQSSQNMPHQQRKQKAEDIISKLLGGKFL